MAGDDNSLAMPKHLVLQHNLSNLNLLLGRRKGGNGRNEDEVITIEAQNLVCATSSP
jgi:hypothetical protein